MVFVKLVAAEYDEIGRGIARVNSVWGHSPVMILVLVYVILPIFIALKFSGVLSISIDSRYYFSAVEMSYI